ncbi:Ger(x)C family spore germination protein [Paenibacillus lignilyticus]|uniref:Ger(X)C family spore germination protein n=1 Tax=Paenibacillus lignilyticus TaxID=1172615 RepID=A0ABS5CKJ5_9BACL|nr:Ger(x)C family spore germination protein [Paenibacillus lignilyticus]MBP3966369.1 Ger(x)C family spore germination protein [Paenibacillus lignilyticus]
MMRRARTAVLLLLCMLSLTACWDIKDVNHRMLPIVMGISYGEAKKYRVFIQVPLPYGRKLISKVHYEEADTISKALTQIDTNIEAGIDFMHLQLVLFDRKVAIDGIRDEMAYMIRSQHMPTKALVAITSQNIEQFLNHTGKSIQTDGSALMNFFNKNAGWSPEINLAYLWQTFGAIHSDTQDVTIPILQSGKSTMMEFVGSAIMSKEKMVGEISQEQSLLVNLYDELFQGSVVETAHQASVSIVNCDNRLRTSWRDGKPVLNMRLKLSLHLLENNGNMTEQQIENALSEAMEVRYKQLFKKLQASKADSLGTGEYFRNKLAFSKLKQWRETYYPQLIPEIKVKCIITNTGDIRKN